jgi:hypothetical protein
MLLQKCNGLEEELETIDTTSRSTQINLKKFPNVILSAIQSKNICLLLDSKGGHLQLQNVDHFPSDTIRISFWRVYANGLPDTFRGANVFFQMVNDVRSDTPLLEKPILTVQKNIGVRDLKEISIILNGRKHIVPVTIETGGTIQTYHGYEPKSIYNKFNQEGGKNSARVYRYKYFHGSGRNIVPIYHAVLSL